jgi:hypothetical protein
MLSKVSESKIAMATLDHMSPLDACIELMQIQPVAAYDWCFGCKDDE